jgi:hypothetical protein
MEHERGKEEQQSRRIVLVEMLQLGSAPHNILHFAAAVHFAHNVAHNN